MAYSKTTWVNGETPVNADNLNKIENELADLDTNKADASDIGDITELETADKTNVVNAINEVYEASIIESGSNSNGEYVKYSNGAMICTKKITLTIPITTASGALYNGSGSLGEMAQTFIDVPDIQVMIVNSSARGWVEQIRDATTSNFGTVYVNRSTATESGGYPLTFHCKATGKWK